MMDENLKGEMMSKNPRFMRRMLVVLMGIILIAVSIIQIVNSEGQLWLNLTFIILGVFEIGLTFFMQRLDIKTAKQLKAEEDNKHNA